jgi:hypothetical protein
MLYYLDASRAQCKTKTIPAVEDLFADPRNPLALKNLCAIFGQKAIV